MCFLVAPIYGFAALGMLIAGNVTLGVCFFVMACFLSACGWLEGQ